MKNLLMDTIITKTTNGVSTVATGLGNKIAEKVLPIISEMDDAQVQELFYDNDKLRQFLEANNEGQSEEDMAALQSDETTVVKALKSQQSKRSKSMAGELNGANIVKVISATFGEMLIRSANNMDYKSRATGTKSHSSAELTEEVLAVYKEDQELLRKAIRNVQAKKCNIKKKMVDEVTPELEEQMAEVDKCEELLMSVRNMAPRGSKSKAVVKDERVDHILGIFNATMVNDKMKKAELLEVIDQIKEIVGYVEEEEVTE